MRTFGLVEIRGSGSEIKVHLRDNETFQLIKLNAEDANYYANKGVITYMHNRDVLKMVASKYTYLKDFIDKGEIRDSLNLGVNYAKNNDGIVIIHTDNEDTYVWYENRYYQFGIPILKSFYIVHGNLMLRTVSSMYELPLKRASTQQIMGVSLLDNYFISHKATEAGLKRKILLD